MNFMRAIFGSFVFLSASSFAAEAARKVECTVKDDPEKRLFRLAEEKADKSTVWAISMKSEETDDEWVVWEIRNKKPELTDQSLKLNYQSPLGATAKWTVDEKSASLEININYDLEINDSGYKIPLDSRVEHFHADKPITMLDCKFSK